MFQDTAQMTNKQKYDTVFMDTFSLQQAALGQDLAYSHIDEWDSIGHMQMIAALEETFNITMETDDIVNFSSYTKGFEILSKYAISFERTP